MVRDPGYGSTSKMISKCAICLLRDTPDVPAGIWTPGAAMGDQLLAVHDSQLCLDRVEVQSAFRQQPFVHVAHGAFPQLPENLEHVQLSLARDDIGQIPPPWHAGTDT